jgi:hypothetical protein
MPVHRVMVVMAEIQLAPAAAVSRMTPLLMVAPVPRNRVPAQADRLLLLTVVIGMEARVSEGPAVPGGRSRARARRRAVAAAADITAVAAVAPQFKPRLMMPQPAAGVVARRSAGMVLRT